MWAALPTVPAWFFVRNGTTWTQQGNKITDTPNNGWLFGLSVALSADGNTALIGAPLLNNGTGFIYKRTGSAWNFIQKLTDATSTAYEGIRESVALSATGDVAILGSKDSNQDRGLLWVFRRNLTTQLWVKEQILAPTSTIPFSWASRRLTISRGGDTLAASGYNDNNNTGAVWMFTHSGGVWSQLGPKITSPISGGFEPSFGHGVSLSGDGKILLVGRPGGGQQGAAFIFSDPSVLSTKQELSPELSLYPNPVKDILHLPRNATFSQVTVSDLSGRILVYLTGPVGQLDCSKLPADMYLVMLRQQEKVQYVRVVKE